jgi:hypothetical protein
MAVVLFMSMGFPWEMREFHVPYDRGHNEMIREKYLNVRALAKMNSTVSLRCCGKPKDCPARLVCTMSGL